MKRLVLGCVFALLSTACGQDAGTGGKPVSFDLQLASEPREAESLERFETSLGWTVELEEAHIALGAVYLYELPGGVAAVSPHNPRSLPVQVWDYLVPSAHAHPGDGHFNGGAVRGEWLGQTNFDALSLEPVSMPQQPGVRGPVRSLSILLDPPRESLGAEADELRGYHAYVVGVASKGAVVVPFEGGLSIPDEGTQRRVDGVPVDAMLEDGVTVRISVHPDEWFAEANFERLLTEADGTTPREPNDDGRYVIVEDNQVRSAWFIGARSANAFSVRETD